MRIPLDEVVFFDAITQHPTTAAVTDADSAPAFDVFEEDTDTGILAAQSMTKRTSKTGNYRGSFTASAANGFEAGKWYNVVVSATVNAIAGKAAVLTFMLVPAETSAGVAKVDTSHVSGTAQTARDIGAAVPAAAPGASGGLPTTNGTKLNQTADLTAGQSVGVSGDLSATMKTSVTTAATAATPTAASVTGAVGSVTAGVTLAASAVQAIWDAATSALTAAGSIGKWILDKLDVVLSTRLATSGYTASPTAVQIRTEMDSNSTKLAAAALEASTQALITTIGVAGGGLTALGDTRLANLDASVASRLATAGYTAPPTAVQNRTEMDANSTRLAAAALETSLQSLVTTVGAAGAGLTAVDDAVIAILSSGAHGNAALKTLIDALTVLDTAIKAKTDLLNFTGTDVKATLDGETVTLVDGQLTMKKNTALANFEFVMIDSTDHVTGKIGVTVTAERNIDGGVFAPCANSAVEVSAGVYKINLAAADLNGGVVMLKFTGAGCDVTWVEILTQP